MKKIVAIFLSLVLLLGLCSVAQAAVQMPTTADQSAAANINHGVSASTLPVIESVEVTDTQVIVTFDKDTIPDASDDGICVRFMTADNQWAQGEPPVSLTSDGVVTYSINSDYPLIAQINYIAYIPNADGGIDINAYYNDEGSLESYSVGMFVQDDSVNEYIYADYNGNDKLTYENYTVNANSTSEGYSVGFYGTSGSLQYYNVDTQLDDGSSLSTQYDQFGRIIWAEYWDGDSHYYIYNDQWYNSSTGEPAEGVSVDVTAIEVPYAEDYIVTTPAAKLENLDLTKGELITEDDGYSYYYDGAVNASYDENGNLVRYSYSNFENTQQEAFSFAENGNVISHRTSAKTDEGYFQTISGIDYYANSGAPKSSFYRTEEDMFVSCAADGSVTSMEYYDEETGCYYYWSQWWGWEVTDSEGNLVEVDASTLPNPEDYKGLELVTVEAVTKDDVKVVTSAASATPSLPIELEDLPSITNTKIEGNTMSVTISADADELAFYEDDNTLDIYMDVSYQLDGETYWIGSYDEEFCSYNPETQTYELTLPEGAVVEDYQLSVYRAIDNMYYSYIISADGVRVSVGNDYLEDVNQSFYYEDGKLVRMSTNLDGYFLASYYTEEGALESYRYTVDENSNATFLADGTLDYITYYDSETEQAIYWDATNGWHTREYADDSETFTATVTEKPADAADPEEVKPLIVVSKKPEHIWFPKNTLGLAAVSMKDLGISSDWHNVAPVDLTTDGTTVFTLVGADAWILGNAYVTVAEGNVTVTYDILDGHGYMKSEKMNWFLTKADLTEENLKADSNYAFGEPVSIADQLGGAETAILFIDSKITFRQPYFDAYNYSTRYYRNRENWKEYREGLIEMIK